MPSTSTISTPPSPPSSPHPQHPTYNNSATTRSWSAAAARPSPTPSPPPVHTHAPDMKYTRCCLDGPVLAQLHARDGRKRCVVVTHARTDGHLTHFHHPPPINTATTKHRNKDTDTQLSTAYHYPPIQQKTTPASSPSSAPCSWRKNTPTWPSWSGPARSTCPRTARC